MRDKVAKALGLKKGLDVKQATRAIAWSDEAKQHPTEYGYFVRLTVQGAATLRTRATQEAEKALSVEEAKRSAEEYNAETDDAEAPLVQGALLRVRVCAHRLRQGKACLCPPRGEAWPPRGRPEARRGEARCAAAEGMREPQNSVQRPTVCTP